jgi:hypothetical protein
MQAYAVTKHVRACERDGSELLEAKLEDYAFTSAQRSCMDMDGSKQRK